MKNISKHEDHFFRGLDILKTKFIKEPSLDEFKTAVRKDAGPRARVDASYVTISKGAIYKAFVLLDGHSYLYLLFPQTTITDKAWVIGKKPTSNSEEAGIGDKIDFELKQPKFKTSPFAALEVLKK